jgi:BarA-like signal transduction histidine kinase
MPDSTNENSTDNTELDPKLAEIIDSVLAVSKTKQPNDYEVLFKVGIEALKFFPPLYFTSIFGTVRSWMPPHKPLSEYNILSLWKPVRAANYLVDTTVPAFSHAPGPIARTILPPVVRHLFWRPSGYFEQADPFACTTSYQKEHWFFLNGIATNKDVAEMNSALLSEIFLRPVTVIHNQTDSTLLDLLQCAVGKSFKTDPTLDHTQTMTEPAIKATIAILEAIKDPEKERVVLICHSQGTIIAANVLRALQNALQNIKRLQIEPSARTKLSLNPLDETALNILYSQEIQDKTNKQQDLALIELIRKLEVYTFANCADKMNYITHVRNEADDLVGIPYIENFANEFDLVARLGVLSPLKKPESKYIEIDGPVYEKTGLAAWGHLLNQHYLFGISEYLEGDITNPYQLSDNEHQSLSDFPRLYEYAAGKRVKPYYL